MAWPNYTQDSVPNYMNPIQRLLELETSFQEFPGRRPGGSGPTGIGHPTNIARLIGPPTRQDLKGYGAMVGEQQEYGDLESQYGKTSQFKNALARLRGLM